MTQGPEFDAANDVAPALPTPGRARDARWDATFQREVVCVLGVPVDVIGIEEAV